MTTSKKMHSRLLAGLLSLCLLCGMLLGMQFLPAAAEEEVEATQFVANFSTMTDTQTQTADLKELFTFYLSKEKSFSEDLADPFAASVDYIGNNRTLQLSLDGKWFKQSSTRTDGETFRDGFGFAPKGNDAIKNFKAVFDVSLGTLAKSAVALSFRSDYKGRITQSGSRAVYQNQDMLVLNNAGYQLVSAGKAGGTTDVYTLPTYTAWANSATVSTATVTVKVVGKTVSLKVVGADNTVYCDVSNLQLNADRAAGSLYFSLLNHDIAVGNIKITNLDESGDVLNWDGSVPVAKPDYVNRFKADFRTMTNTETQAADLKELFTFHLNSEKKYVGPIEDIFKISNELMGDTSWRTSQLSLDGQWLKQTDAYDSGETFRQGFVLVPKGNNAIKNFKATFDVQLDDYAKSAVALSFRSDMEGRILRPNDKRVYANQEVLVLNNAGYQLYSAGTAGATADAYTLPTYTAWANSATVSTATVTVEVVGLSVSLKVVGADDTVYCDTQSLTLAADRAAGYLYFSMMSGDHAIGDITITNLDATGNELNWDGTVPEIPSDEQEDNTAVIDGDVINVKAGEGYELKAGSLIVTDAEGNKFVPERVGYREGGNAAQYRIPAAAVGECTVAYEFIRPGDANGYNIGFLGTSVYEEGGKGDLRFVYRLNIDKDNKVLYNGEKVVVKEYGLLLASSAILPNAADLDIETAADSMHVHQFAWPTSGKFYDKCDEYADIAVQVNNIPTAAANVNLHSRVYLILGNDAVVYMDAVTANYANAK